MPAYYQNQETGETKQVPEMVEETLEMLSASTISLIINMGQNNDIPETVLLDLYRTMYDTAIDIVIGDKE